jgi:glutamate synthase (NADPH/NADH) small chain
VAKPTGFIEFKRQPPPKREVAERIGDYREIVLMQPEAELVKQAARCMDCGIPHCHSYGCPVVNLIPDWNDMVYRGQWRKALDLLQSTNNFPEFTGRICPAPCEAACTLNIDKSPVTICHIELQIVERGWKEGWIVPQRRKIRTGKKIAVIGSGPAGMAAAQQLARAGHEAVLFEKNDRIGGILRYGIPDFKLEKWVIDRRLEQMAAEGVSFETSVDVGVDISAGYLSRTFDAIILTTGAGVPRDLPVPGRDLKGIHFAMPFLTRQNKINALDMDSNGAAMAQFDKDMTAAGKHVVVIGGGDTGSDCIGTSRRQGAKRITQIELLPQPPDDPAPANPWPAWPLVMRTSTSQEEGCDRLWSIATKEFIGDNGGNLNALRCVKLDWSPPDESGRMNFKEIKGSEFEIKAELALFAMGFVHTEHGPLLEDLGVETDERGNMRVDSNYMTAAKGVFAAGDSIKGASLVVHAIALGRKAASAVNRYLK